MTHLRIELTTFTHDTIYKLETENTVMVQFDKIKVSQFNFTPKNVSKSYFEYKNTMRTVHYSPDIPAMCNIQQVVTNCFYILNYNGNL